MGFPWLGREMRQRLRHSNTMANRSLSHLREAEQEERIATLEHLYNSWLRYWNQVPELEQDFNYGFREHVLFWRTARKMVRVAGQQP